MNEYTTQAQAMTEIKHLTDRIAELEAEAVSCAAQDHTYHNMRRKADRYREALERIVEFDAPEPYDDWAASLQDIAREALEVR